MGSLAIGSWGATRTPRWFEQPLAVSDFRTLHGTLHQVRRCGRQGDPRAPRAPVAAQPMVYAGALPRFRTRLLMLLVCAPSVCIPSLVCPPSFAQTPDVVNDEARTSFASGMEAFQQGRFRAAVEYFKEADRLAPSARLSFNIALTYERMGDAPNALAAYRDYLRRAPHAENARETSVRISELELELQKSGVQQLSVLSTPTGATVLVDDISRGVTPWTGEMPPGAHRLTLRSRGYDDLHQDFDLSPRHSVDLAYQLHLTEPHIPPPTGSLALATPSPEPAPGVEWWTWAAFGGSAALLLGSGAFELSRRHLESDLKGSTEPQVDSKGTYDQMTSRKTTARVLLGSGAALGVLGGVSLYLDLTRKASNGTTLGLACAGGDCQAVARGFW
jgi:tetratricopeptide (TPR) repeat protein